MRKCPYELNTTTTATLVTTTMTGARLALPVSSIVARDTILVLDGCLGRRSPAAFRRTVRFTTTAPSTASTKSWNRVWRLHVRIEQSMMVATPPSTFLNVLGGLGFTFTLPIILLALVLQLVLLTMAMTRAMVLIPPPRNIGFARRRRSVIAGPHLGRKY